MREKRKKPNQIKNNPENKNKEESKARENIMEEGPIKINYNPLFLTYEKYENMLIGIKIEINQNGESKKVLLIDKLRETYKEKYYEMLSLIHEELLKEKKELSKEEKEIISYFFSHIELSNGEEQEQKLKFLKALLEKREELRREEIKDLILQAKSLEKEQNIWTKALYINLTGFVSAKYFKPLHLNLIKKMVDEKVFEGNEIIGILLLSRDMLNLKTTSSYFLESLSFLVELTTTKINNPYSTKKLIPPEEVGKIILDYNTAFIPTTIIRGEYRSKEILPYPVMENMHSLILSLKERGVELLKYLAEIKLKYRQNKEFIFLIHQINEEGGKERVTLFFDKIKELRELFGNPIKKNYLSLLEELYEKYKEEGKDASSKLIEDLEELKTLDIN